MNFPVKLFGFPLIFLLLIEVSVYSQDISTIGEVFDFEIGDVFHYKDHESYGAGQEGYLQWINDTIIDKIYSLNNDTVIYTVKRHLIETSSWNTNWTYDTYSFVKTYTNFESPINNGVMDTVYPSPTNYNGRIVNFLTWTVYHNQWYEADSTVYKKKWVVGCGLVWNYYQDHPDWCHGEFLLKYYKKGDEEWGSPVIIVSTPEIQSDNLSIYPNPTYNELIIDAKKSGDLYESYEIYSINGKLKMNNSLMNSDFNRINVERLDRGMYLLKLIADDKIYQSKFIKK